MNDAFKKFDLTGKTALVTGGGTGIGYFMTRALARSGATVMIAARRENLLKEAANRLTTESYGNNVLFHTVDLADRDSIENLSQHAIKTLGGVDIYIGNAGQDGLEPIDEISDPVIDQMLQVNVAANIALFRAFLPHMRKKKWGRVMFSSSGSTVCASPHEGMGMYTAAKGALNAFTRTAATEVGHDGITVNSIVLGIFVTDMIRDIHAQMEQAKGPGEGKAFLDSFASMTALGRWGECEDVEGLIQLLASNAGSYITGTNLVIDGGLTIMIRPNQPSS